MASSEIYYYFSGDFYNKSLQKLIPEMEGFSADNKKVALTSIFINKSLQINKFLHKKLNFTDIDYLNLLKNEIYQNKIQVGLNVCLSEEKTKYILSKTKNIKFSELDFFLCNDLNYLDDIVLMLIKNTKYDFNDCNNFIAQKVLNKLIEENNKIESFYEDLSKKLPKLERYKIEVLKEKNFNYFNIIMENESLKLFLLNNYNLFKNNSKELDILINQEKIKDF